MEYNLGWALRFSGKPAQATTRLRHVVELHAKHGTTADLEQCHLGLGLAALSLNDPLAAQRHITTAATLTAARGDDRLGKAALHEAQGELRGALGDVPGARTKFAEAIAIRIEALGADALGVAYTRVRFGAMLLRAGQPAEALVELRAALATREKSLPLDSPTIAETLELIGRAELAHGDLTAARASLERALQIRQAALPPTSLDIARSLRYLGELRLSAGEPTAAVDLLTRAVTSLTAGQAEPHELSATRFVLARALASAGQRDAAFKAARQARDAYQTAGEHWQRETAEIDAWLASNPDQPLRQVIPTSAGPAR
jgi:tetratricopeptide (TPR) repeat protein